VPNFNLFGLKATELRLTEYRYPIAFNAGKVEKLILDLVPDPDQSQNLIDSSLSQNLPYKNNEHSPTTFWVILFTFNVSPC